MAVVIGPVPEQMRTTIWPLETAGMNPAGMASFINSASARIEQAKGRLARTKRRSRCTVALLVATHVFVMPERQ